MPTPPTPDPTAKPATRTSEGGTIRNARGRAICNRCRAPLTLLGTCEDNCGARRVSRLDDDPPAGGGAE